MRFALLHVWMLCALFLAPAVAQKAKDSAYKKTYVSDMEAFLDEVQKSYPFFDLKDLRKEWTPTKKRLKKEAKKCKTDADFMVLVFEGIHYLRDAHMTVTECAVELGKRDPTYYTGASFLPASEDRVVVMYPPEGQGASLKPGMIVDKIDGKDARKVLEERAVKAWEAGGSFSSPQRARLWEYRYGLQGEKGEKHVLECLDGRKKKKVKLACRTEVAGWAHSYNLPADLVRVGKSFYYTLLPSGVGYMYLRRVDSSIPEGMAVALAKHPKTKGWIVDLCGNTGGGYGEDLRQQVNAVPKPVAAIIDAGCISAGETLVRDFVKMREARVFGTTTAGSSSSKRVWAFPSGIAKIRISTRSRYGPDGEPIEFHGIAPHEVVEAVPEEVREGQNSAILRAEAYVLNGGE